MEVTGIATVKTSFLYWCAKLVKYGFLALADAVRARAEFHCRQQYLSGPQAGARYVMIFRANRSDM